MGKRNPKQEHIMSELFPLIRMTSVLIKSWAPPIDLKLKALLVSGVLCCFLFSNKGFAQSIEKKVFLRTDFDDVRFEFIHVDGQDNVYMNNFFDFNENDRDVGLAKFDSSMNLIWSKRFLTNGKESGLRAFVVIDGDAIYYSATMKGLGPQAAGVLAKFNFDGELLWSMLDQNTEWRGEDNVFQSYGGDIVWASTSTLSGHTGNPIINVVSSDGTIINEMTYENPMWIIPDNTVATTDGGLVMLGKMENADLLGDFDMFLLKLDSDYEVEWAKRIGTSQNEHPGNGRRGTIIEVQGGFLGAHYRESNVGAAETILFKTNTMGTVLWSKLLTSDEGVSQNPMMLIEGSPDRYYISHTTISDGINIGALTCIDSTGSLVWNREFADEREVLMRGAFIQENYSTWFLTTTQDSLAFDNRDYCLFEINLTEKNASCGKLENSLHFEFADLSNSLHEVDVEDEFVPVFTNSLVSTQLDIVDGELMDLEFVCPEPPAKVRIVGESSVCLGDSTLLRARGDTLYRWYDTDSSHLLAADLDSIWVRPIQDMNIILVGNEGMTDSMVVRINDLGLCPHLIIPEVYELISPNGDGDNEGLTIKNLEHYDGAKVNLYNVWGEEVFHAENYINGSLNGDHLPDGNYYYQVFLKGYQPTLAGRLTIRR